MSSGRKDGAPGFVQVYNGINHTIAQSIFLQLLKGQILVPGLAVMVKEDDFHITVDCVLDMVDGSQVIVQFLCHILQNCAGFVFQLFKIQVGDLSPHDEEETQKQNTEKYKVRPEILNEGVASGTARKSFWYIHMFHKKAMPPVGELDKSCRFFYLKIL